MRINVYGDELNKRVEHVKRTPRDTEIEYSGIQFFLGRDFKHTPGDDDTSAVVFWYHSEYERSELRAALEAALKLVDENPV
jgi:hypothetical protein